MVFFYSLAGRELLSSAMNFKKAVSGPMNFFILVKAFITKAIFF